LVVLCEVARAVTNTVGCGNVLDARGWKPGRGGSVRAAPSIDRLGLGKRLMRWVSIKRLYSKLIGCRAGASREISETSIHVRRSIGQRVRIQRHLRLPSASSPPGGEMPAVLTHLTGFVRLEAFAALTAFHKLRLVIW
jgi:hypothetical protein